MLLTPIDPQAARFALPVRLKPPARPRYIGVQYARAFAAIAVLLFHASQREGVNFAVGARGVDVFFVISGFIMWSITAQAQPAPGDFFLNRLRRIAPLYWLATLALVAAALAGVMPGLRAELSVPHLVQSLLFIPHVSPGSEEIWPVLVPGWTLNFEMFFYAVFAAFLLAPRQLRLLGLTATFVGLVALGAWLQPTNAIAQTYTSPLILEFLAGILVAEVVARRGAMTLPVALLAMAAGVAALVVIPFAHNLAAAVGCALAGTAIVAGVVSLDLQGRTPAFKPLSLLGDASYSIYLWHGLAVSLVAVVGGKLGLPPIAAIALALVGGVALGLASYWFLEKPLEKLLAPKRRRPSPVARQPTYGGFGASLRGGSSR